MTIASKTNLLRIGFMGLGLGKGLTTDYTNNADGEGKFVLYCEDLPANHANLRESQRGALSKQS